ncbi:MAG: hypothetical protein ABFE01_19450 [Phycisphaerales bacterium]
MAKRLINDEDAKHLITKLNRRMGAIAFLTGGHLSWQGVIAQVAVFALWAVWLYFSARREDWLLSMVVWALWGLIETYNAGMNRRIEALAELLRQNGMLRTELPPSSDPEA